MLCSSARYFTPIVPFRGMMPRVGGGGVLAGYMTRRAEVFFGVEDLHPW